jgi:dihydroflavonol-4-reductase
MPKSLVTGGSGFLGSHLVEVLVALGEKVRVLVRPTSKVAHLESLKVELVYGDLNNIQSLRKAIRNIERVITVPHLLLIGELGKDFVVLM